MTKTDTTMNRDEERAEPLADRRDGEIGAPAVEQGISNRPGDNEDDADGEFEDDDDELDEEDEEEDADGAI